MKVLRGGSKIRRLPIGTMTAALIMLSACTTPKQDQLNGRIHVDLERSACFAESDRVERLVCEDDELRGLQTILQDIYTQLAAIPDAYVFQSQSQQDWRQVRNECVKKQCLEVAYHRKIARMQLALNVCKGNGPWKFSGAERADQCRNMLTGQGLLRTPKLMPVSNIAPKTQESNLTHRQIIRPIAEHNDTIEGPSFLCEKAKTNVEKEICGSNYLSGLDRELNSLYTQKRANPEVSRDIRESQLEWLSNERAKCESVTGIAYDSNGTRIVSCIGAAYKKRITVLKAIQ